MESSIKASVYDFFGYFIPGLLFSLVLSLECYLNKAWTIEQITTVVKDSNALFAGLLIIFAYFIGHIMNAFSSLLYEKVFTNKRNRLENIMDPFSRKKLDEIFQEEYNQDFSESNSRLLVCCAEESMPKAYSTALVFLTIYGMTRSASFVFLAAAVFRLAWMVGSVSFQYWYIELAYIVLAVILYYQYARFVRYYNRHIVSCFILAHSKKEETASGNG